MKNLLVESLWLQLKIGFSLLQLICIYCCRKADTLLPIIHEWIEKGSVIVSDFWRAYDCLDREGYKHLKVNHSLHFKVSY